MPVPTDFASYTEASDVREYCIMCELPKLSIEGAHTMHHTRYVLVECDREDCTVHCKC